MTSYAKTQSPTPIKAASPQAKFRADQVPERPGRTSRMVEQDRPHPVPRPAPDMAYETDRTTFNRRWQDEAREAKEHGAQQNKADKDKTDPDKATLDKAERRAAFIKERTDPETGGQVRVFNRQTGHSR